MLLKPAEIEKESFARIQTELLGRTFPPLQDPIVKRVIHTTADFEYADTMYFSDGVIEAAQQGLREGCILVTDTQMVRSGINKKKAAEWGCDVVCFMDDEGVAQEAAQRQTTRAVVSMERAAALGRPCIFAIGNAPTALLRLVELTAEKQLAPLAVIGVPVGFVNVVESKEQLMQSGLRCIVNRGRKGGSNVAAAICNALLYNL